MIRDVLSELALEKLTLDEVYALYDTLMDSDPSTLATDLGLSRRSGQLIVTAWASQSLAHWRQSGWPSLCLTCDETIAIDAFGWLAREVADDAHRLVHISCLRTGALAPVACRKPRGS